MISIFYDLETSDTCFLGQIINFSFIAVDDSWREVGEYSAEIKLSRLQLPSPEAVLANRVNVLELQERANLREPEAMRGIVSFIGSFTDREPVALVGFNSNRFDLPFLRTSLIRNGFKPYFDNRLIYRDLLYLVRKLAATNKDFPRPIVKKIDEGKEVARISLTLQEMGKAFGVLSGEQSHFSKDDVLLTIALARSIEESFGIDVRKFDAYEGREFEEYKRQSRVIEFVEPEYDPTLPEIGRQVPMSLIDANHRMALWVDLDRYRDGAGRGAIRPLTKATASLFLGTIEATSPEIQKLAEAAQKEFKDLTVNNFFSKSECDVEQDIYRVDFDGIDLLHRAIWQLKALPEKCQREVRILFSRFKLAAYEWGSGDDAKVREMLAAYARYRYGGQALLSKQRSPEATFHPKFGELNARLDSLLSTADSDLNSALLEALREFYLHSDLYKVTAGNFCSNDPANIEVA